MNDDSKWAMYRNLSFAPIQITNLLQSSKSAAPAVAEPETPLQNGKHPVAPDANAESPAEAKVETKPESKLETNLETKAGAPVPEAPLPPAIPEAASAESGKMIYRIGVGAAAFVGLSLIVMFLFRPVVPSAAAPQLASTALAERQQKAIAAVLATSPSSPEGVTQEPLNEQLAAQAATTATPAEAPTDAATATPLPSPTPLPTAVPTQTPVPLLPQAASLPQAIAFTRGAEGKGDIYTMRAGESEPVAIANSDCDEAEPDWSPDGANIVFQTNCNGSYDLAIAPAGGGEIRYLTETEQYDELDPSFSPDGASVVFLRLLRGTAADAEGDLWSMNVENGHSFALEVSGRAPVWSADGLKLAYMSLRNGNWDVYVHDFIRGDDELISFGCPTQCGWPEWSPDSSALAFSVTTSPTDYQQEEIWLWTPTRRLPRPWITGAVGRPSWSLAGKMVYNSGQGLEVSDAENPERQLLLADTAAWAPEWAK